MSERAIFKGVIVGLDPFDPLAGVIVFRYDPDALTPREQAAYEGKHGKTRRLEPGMRELARLDVAGGNIRNIALNAAFLAADAGEPVRMEHLLGATRSECAKLEKPLTEAEIGGWV